MVELPTKTFKTRYTKMVEKVNGFTKPGYESLTGNLDFFTVRTLVNILPTGSTTPGADGNVVGDATTQEALDMLIETVSTRAQPVIMSDVEVSVEAVSSIVDLPATAGEGATSDDNVFVLKFAIEHTEAWDVEMLGEALDAAGGAFVYRTPTTNNNVAFVRNLTL